MWPGRAGAAPAIDGSDAPTSSIHTISLPGGVEGIRRALDDRVATPPLTIVVEIVRRAYGGAPDVTRKDATIVRLHEWLRACMRAKACETASLAADQVPLPGPPAFWHDVVLEGRVPVEQTLLGILDNRRAALLYTALMSATEEVRSWLLNQPDLVRRFSEGDCGTLIVLAPFLRLHEGRWQLPGGAAAAPVWVSLASAAAEDPAAFLLALLRNHGGLLAYIVELIATLTPDQQRVVFALGGDPSTRMLAGRGLLDALGPIGRWWQPGERPFWRPGVDPAFLLSQLPATPSGRLALPGGRSFWSFVLAGNDLDVSEDDARDAWRESGEIAPAWLVDRLLSAPVAEQPIRYEQLLFASRWLASEPDTHARDLAIALRGYVRFPQLLRVLDRIGTADAPRIAALVRRADALTRSSQAWRDRAALIRWQCMLGLLDYAVRRGAASRDEVTHALDALAATSEHEDRGARLQAITAWLGLSSIEADLGTRPVDRAVIERLTRTHLAEGQRVQWEDTTYRVDFGASERDRLANARGREARPWFDAAWSAFALADRAAKRGGDRVADFEALAAIVEAMRLDRPVEIDDVIGRAASDAAATARRLLGRSGSETARSSARRALEDLAEALATQGFIELVYAANMGWAEELPLRAMAAARRHSFVADTASGTETVYWRAPFIVTDTREPWHLSGSLLGMDVALAPVALRRTSLRPLTAAPSLNVGDRAVLITTAALLDRRVFTEEGQHQLVDLVARGRTRVKEANDPTSIRRLAEEAGLTPLRQAMVTWIADLHPAAVTGMFSIGDLLRLGAGGGPLPDAVRPWGNYQLPITGRLFAGDLPHLPWERYVGRAPRTLACALPDLQLTLAAWLAEMRLPAVLVPDLMAAATADLVNTATSRHPDDYDALTERVRRVDQDAIERYLGLLTTGGPLRAEAASRTP